MVAVAQDEWSTLNRKGKASVGVGPSISACMCCAGAVYSRAAT